MIENITINNCTHCSKNIEENFCSNCGQKRYKRIDRKYIWDEIQYTLIHVNKGFLYSVKSVLKNPGKTAREFVDGDRVSHYKPISLAFVLASISAAISITVLKLYKMMETMTVNQKVNSELMQGMFQFVNKYNAYIMLLFVPVVALLTWLVFRKWGHNYYEHIVMNAIGVSLYCLLCILVLYPVFYVLKGNSNLVLQISFISFAFIPILMVIFFKGFYPEKPLKSIIFKILLVVLLLFLSYVLLIFLTVIVLFLLKGKETLQYVKPK